MNDPRDRFKFINRASEEEDIFSMWKEQEAMRLEDIKIEKELKEAQRRAKELRKTLLKHKFGEQKNDLLEKTKKYSTVAYQYTVKLLKRLRARFFTLSRKYQVGLSIGVLVIIGGTIAVSRGGDTSRTLGDSTQNPIISEPLPREQPGFELLTPNGVSQSNYDVVRISPDDAEASYTYLDKISNGAILRITQQEVPKDFSLEETATNFQATEKIVVNNNTIYHGYSEKGDIQSLIFIKDDKLVSIRSPQKFADEFWVSYYTQLK
jgi:hypothetical protein